MLILLASTLICAVSDESGRTAAYGDSHNLIAMAKDRLVITQVPGRKLLKRQLYYPHELCLCFCRDSSGSSSQVYEGTEYDWS